MDNEMIKDIESLKMVIRDEQEYLTRVVFQRFTALEKQLEAIESKYQNNIDAMLQTVGGK